MKKIICAVMGTFLCMTSASAQREDGKWTTSVNAGYVLSMSSIDDEDLSNRIAVDVTEGYQITPHFFAGAGVGFQYFHQGSAWCMPIYLAPRYDFIEGPISPFVEPHIGYSFGDWQGLYFNPQVGVRFNLKGSLGLNVGIGYLLQTLKDVSGTSGDLTFKIGLDF